MLELIEPGAGVRHPGVRGAQPRRPAAVRDDPGVAALVNAGMIDSEQLDELVTDATAVFLRGPRVPAH
jgi:hypothetical protein